jgi:hypothetical protein
MEEFSQNSTHRLQGDTANSTSLATQNETMPYTKNPIADIAKWKELQPGRQGC